MLYRILHICKFFLLMAIFGMMILACTSGSIFNNSEANAPEPVERTNSNQEPENLAPKRPPIVEVSGLIDFHQSPYRNLLTTVPDKGSPTFFAAVPRMANRENEYRMGHMLLARQAAMYREAGVTAKFLTQSNNRDMGYREQVEVDIDKSLVRSMVDKIKITDHYQDVQGSYFSGVLKGIQITGFKVQTEVTDTVPQWFLNPPSYEGYIVAVGTSGRHMFIAESFLQSDRQALAAIAKQLDIEVKQKRDDLEKEYQGSAYQQLNLQITDTTVRGFYVIDRWVSSDGNTHYSLAVCPVK
ncbi:MAG: LPP20 family lipoprotein [Spirochaetaceae bacterium]|nr:LPP20 family lipoprotein [Spirochaetaceae bacterium]MCF7948274.1 LPP20 family lipoprotein [Spirochaetia bacterium]MCF7952066.1 LPP20 family lipoprotein [Spirochaetaceae bacterium]